MIPPKHTSMASGESDNLPRNTLKSPLRLTVWLIYIFIGYAQTPMGKKKKVT